MAILLRKVLKPNRWPERPSEPVALAELPSDPVGDLPTTNGTLSVWLVEDDRRNFERLVAALATIPQKIDHFHYLEFSSDLVTALGLGISHAEEGGSKDSYANKQWHRDILVHHGMKLVELTHALFMNCEVQLIQQKKVGQLIAAGVSKGEIDQTLPKGIRDALPSA